MKRWAISALAITIVLGGATAGFSQVINNVCWSINGFPLKTSLTLAGSASGTTILDLDGFGTSTNVPIKGTLNIPPAGNIRMSFLIQAASPGQNAVVHQLSLNRNTLNGTGNFRWFDGTNEGEDTATLTACGALAPSKSEEGDRVSQGLR